MNDADSESRTKRGRCRREGAGKIKERSIPEFCLSSERMRGTGRPLGIEDEAEEEDAEEEDAEKGGKLRGGKTRRNSF